MDSKTAARKAKADLHQPIQHGSRTLTKDEDGNYVVKRHVSGAGNIVDYRGKDFNQADAWLMKNGR